MDGYITHVEDVFFAPSDDEESEALSVPDSAPTTPFHKSEPSLTTECVPSSCPGSPDIQTALATLAAAATALLTETPPPVELVVVNQPSSGKIKPYKAPEGASQVAATPAKPATAAATPAKPAAAAATPAKPAAAAAATPAKPTAAATPAKPTAAATPAKPAAAAATPAKPTAAAATPAKPAAAAATPAKPTAAAVTPAKKPRYIAKNPKPKTMCANFINGDDEVLKREFDMDKIIADIQTKKQIRTCFGCGTVPRNLEKTNFPFLWYLFFFLDRHVYLTIDQTWKNVSDPRGGVNDLLRFFRRLSLDDMYPFGPAGCSQPTFVNILVVALRFLNDKDDIPTTFEQLSNSPDLFLGLQNKSRKWTPTVRAATLGNLIIKQMCEGLNVHWKFWTTHPYTNEGSNAQRDANAFLKHFERTEHFKNMVKPILSISQYKVDFTAIGSGSKSLHCPRCCLTTDTTVLPPPMLFTPNDNIELPSEPSIEEEEEEEEPKEKEQTSLLRKRLMCKEEEIRRLRYEISQLKEERVSLTKRQVNNVIQLADEFRAKVNEHAITIAPESAMGKILANSKHKSDDDCNAAIKRARAEVVESMDADCTPEKMTELLCEATARAKTEHEKGNRKMFKTAVRTWLN
jgi:hypothetical protein